jgi:hypothetical protein
MKKSQLRHIIKKVIKEQLTEPSKDCCKWCTTVLPNAPNSIPPPKCEDWMCEYCKGDIEPLKQAGAPPLPFPCNAHPLDPNFGCHVFQECGNPSNTTLPYNVGSNNTTWFANSGITTIGQVIEVDVLGSTEYWEYTGPQNGYNLTPSNNPNPLSIVGNACPIFGCTDATANNYNSLATIDDGSCTYTATGDMHIGLAFTVCDCQPPTATSCQTQYIPGTTTGHQSINGHQCNGQLCQQSDIGQEFTTTLTIPDSSTPAGLSSPYFFNPTNTDFTSLTVKLTELTFAPSPYFNYSSYGDISPFQLNSSNAGIC